MVDDSAAGDEFDSPAEVDAAFRTQRRIAVGYFIVFVGGVLLIPVGTVAAQWWPGGRLSTWATGFVLAGAGLYVFFFVLGLSAASLANGVERRMLGTQADDTGDPGP
ncbi:hypothetical protein BH23ACT10_BH23ACT10_02760 [soil metagenome]